MSDIQGWTEYLQEAEAAYVAAEENQVRLWISEHAASEGYREAAERTARERARWEARLIAYNAYMDWSKS